MTSQRDRKKAIRQYAKDNGIGYTAAKAHFDRKSSLADIISSVVSGERENATLIEMHATDLLPAVNIHLEHLLDVQNRGSDSNGSEVFRIVIANGRNLPGTRRSVIYESSTNVAVYYGDCDDDLSLDICRVSEHGERYDDDRIKEELNTLLQHIRDALDGVDLNPFRRQLEKSNDIHVHPDELSEHDINLLNTYSSIRLYDRWFIQQDEHGYFYCLPVQKDDGVTYARGGSIRNDGKTDKALILHEWSDTKCLAFDFFVESFDLDVVYSALESKLYPILESKTDKSARIVRDDYTVRVLVRKDHDDLENIMTRISMAFRKIGS